MRTDGSGLTASRADSIGIVSTTSSLTGAGTRAGLTSAWAGAVIGAGTTGVTGAAASMISGASAATRAAAAITGAAAATTGTAAATTGATGAAGDGATASAARTPDVDLRSRSTRSK